MIRIQNVSKYYRKSKVKALDNISLEIGQGMFGLLGDNGAGKTTFMNILSTLLQHSEGKIFINNIALEKRNYTQLRNMIGYMPQETGGYPNLTVKETLDYFSLLNGLGERQKNKRVEQLLEYTNLQNHKDKKFKNLSGGMKRRLNLAMAIINDPQILIVDEPTTGVDPYERIRMRNLLLKLGEEKTVILSTHIIEDISYTCKNLAILKEGKLKYQGTVDNLIKQSQNETWLIDIFDENELKRILNQHLVVSTVKQENLTQVKVISKTKPSERAIQVVPTLEDAYISIGRM